MLKILIHINDVCYTEIIMMGYGYGSGSMMGGLAGFGAITWLVVTIDLVLLGIWLWQQISKK